MDPILTPAIIGGSLLLFALSRRRRAKAKDVDLPDVDDPDGPTDAPDDPERPRPEEPEHEQRLHRIAELMGEYLSPTPVPGKFSQVRYGDNLSDLAKQALDTVGNHTNQQRLHYIHCLSSGEKWNMRIYGTPSTSKVFPEMYLAPGIGVGVRVAFLPRNQDALAQIAIGVMPSMTVDPETGAPDKSMTGDHYGLLWYPPVAKADLDSGEMPTCAPYSWADGSSTIDPDPELLGLLETGFQ